jgi:hypothetical protein
MNEADNRRAVERLIEGLNAKDVSVMSEVFTDDSEMVYPQSGEAIRGRVNRQTVYTAIPRLPSIAPYRTIAAGDIVVTKAILDYGDDRYNTVFVFECRDGRSSARPLTGRSRSRQRSGGRAGSRSPRQPRRLWAAPEGGSTRNCPRQATRAVGDAR